MLGTLYEPPKFVDGQELSAFSLTVIDKNTAKMESFVYGPQPLPLDSWLFSPKAIPLSSSQPYQEIFFGSFLYRKGMTELTIGFYLSFESAYTPVGTSDALVAAFNNNFSSNCGTTAVAILLGTDSNSKSYYTNPTKGYRAVTQFNGQSAYTPSGFSFATANNAYNTAYTTYTATSTSGLVNSGDRFVSLNNDRLQKIFVDLTQLNFTDGEIVPIKLAILGSATEARKSISSNFTRSGVTKYPSMQNLNPQLLKVAKVDPSDTYYLKYSTAFADVTVDLSYSTSWPNQSFPSSGVITADDFNVVTTKQKHLIERLRHRPRILTGSFVFYPAYSNSVALYYPQFNNKSTTALGKQVTTTNARSFNGESVLASYSWRPQMSVYDQLGVNFKYLTNTKTKASLIVDLPEAPMSLASYRTAYYNDDFLIGYATSGGDSMAKTYPHFVTSQRYKDRIERVVSSGYRSANTKFFQVRIPSPTTPVFDRKSGSYSTGYYFEDESYYEDSVFIDFQKAYQNNTFSAWGLAKGVDNYTSQIGLISEVPSGLLPSGLEIPADLQRPQPIYKGEVYSTVSGYNSVFTGYPHGTNRQQWKWVSPSNAPMNPRPINLHFHDYSQRYLESKNSYIGFYFQYGCFVMNSLVNNYSMYTEYDPHVFYTVSGIHQFFKEADTRLDALYRDMFSTANSQPYNPYFYKEPVFWGQPITPLMRNDNDLVQYNKKLFYFTGKRLADLLIVRGRNVTLYYGELTEISRDSGPEGSLIPLNSIDWNFANSSSVISGDYEGTVVIDLSSLEGLAYGSYYHLQGDLIVYAAEFFEEPS